MDGLIRRSALLEKIQPVDFLYGDDEAPAYSGMAVSAGDIESAPTVDAVEVVRCKDCKRFKPCKEIEGVSWTGYCKHGEFHTDEDDFCSRGERRTDV